MIQVMHKKSGDLYHITKEDIINATNANDGQHMVLYQNIYGQMFVRETNEFWKKFELY